jgi:Fe-S cluster biogenesis protein NfuA
MPKRVFCVLVDDGRFQLLMAGGTVQVFESDPGIVTVRYRCVATSG